MVVQAEPSRRREKKCQANTFTIETQTFPTLNSGKQSFPQVDTLRLSVFEQEVPPGSELGSTLPSPRPSGEKSYLNLY